MPRKSAAASDTSSVAEDVPPRKSNKKQQPPPGDEEDDEEEGEEFVVEKIRSHRFESDGSIKYEVKWQGYGDKDNTWEPEENLEHCPEELKTYFDSVGGKPTAKEKGTPAASKKRKVSQGPAAEETPTAPTSGKGRGRGKKAKTDTPTNGSTLDSFPPKASFRPPQGSWEDAVISIDTLEKDENNDIHGFVMWCTGDRSKHNTKVLNDKCPQKMLQFYEAHLQFNPVTKPREPEPEGVPLGPKVEEPEAEFQEDEDEEEHIKPVASALT